MSSTWGNLQNFADRLDPEHITVLVHKPRTSLEPAFELRLGEKRTGHFQDLVGSAQFFDLALQVFDPLRLGGADAWPSSGSDFILLDPVQPRMGHTANLRRNRLDLPGVNYPELSASTILSGAGGR